jgi:hypothetical protein
VKIYIAGPYTKGDVVVNIRRVVFVADEIAKMGHTPFIPHLSHLWHTISPHPYDFWIKQDLEWLRCCDAMIRLGGESEGADIEVGEARKLGIHVYFDTWELRRVLHNQEEG